MMYGYVVFSLFFFLGIVKNKYITYGNNNGFGAWLQWMLTSCQLEWYRVYILIYGQFECAQPGL